jgi:hypothetical protein
MKRLDNFLQDTTPFINSDFHDVLQEQHMIAYSSYLDGLNDQKYSTSSTNRGIILQGLEVINLVPSSTTERFSWTLNITQDTLVYFDGNYYDPLDVLINPSGQTLFNNVKSLYLYPVTFSVNRFFKEDDVKQTGLSQSYAIDYRFDITSNGAFPGSTMGVPYILFEFGGTSRRLSRLLKLNNTANGDVLMSHNPKIYSVPTNWLGGSGVSYGGYLYRDIDTVGSDLVYPSWEITLDEAIVGVNGLLNIVFEWDNVRDNPIGKPVYFGIWVVDSNNQLFTYSTIRIDTLSDRNVWTNGPTDNYIYFGTYLSEQLGGDSSPFEINYETIPPNPATIFKSKYTIKLKKPTTVKNYKLFFNSNTQSTAPFSPYSWGVGDNDNTGIFYESLYNGNKYIRKLLPASSLRNELEGFIPVYEMSGRFPVGLSSNSPQTPQQVGENQFNYGTPSNIGGLMSVKFSSNDQLPAHNHGGFTNPTNTNLDHAHRGLSVPFDARLPTRIGQFNFQFTKRYFDPAEGYMSILSAARSNPSRYKNFRLRANVEYPQLSDRFQSATTVTDNENTDILVLSPPIGINTNTANASHKQMIEHFHEFVDDTNQIRNNPNKPNVPHENRPPYFVTLYYTKK